MRFKDWLIDESARSAIMYHGTSMSYWSEIKTKGLEPFPAQRSWDIDPDANFHFASRASYGGIYITGNVLTAVSSAGRTARKNNAGRLILAIQVDPRVLVADEDSVTYIVGKLSLPGVVTIDSTVAYTYISLKMGDDPEYIEKARKNYAEMNSRMLLNKIPNANNALKTRLHKMLYDMGFEATLTRLAAHVSDRSRSYALSNYHGNVEVQFPSVQEGELAYKTFVDKLTYLLRKLADPELEDDIAHVARIMKKVGFEGPNRIVYAAEIVDVPNGQYSRNALRPLYGKPPHEMMVDWQKKIGEFVEV